MSTYAVVSNDVLLNCFQFQPQGQIETPTSASSETRPTKHFPFLAPKQAQQTPVDSPL